MKPSHILYMNFFPIVSSFATTADYNSSAPKVLEGSNAAVHDQAFKHDTTLSNLNTMLVPSDHDNHATEKCDSVGKAIDETSGPDNHGTFVTEKRGFGDLLYKLFGLPDRNKSNEEKHGIGNATPGRRNDNEQSIFHHAHDDKIRRQQRG
jgi:hypothetical protein